MDEFCKSLHPFRTNVHSTPPGVKSAQPEPGYPPAKKRHRYVFTAMRKTHCIFRRSGDAFGREKSRAEEQERRHQGHAEAGRKVAPGRCGLLGRGGRGGPETSQTFPSQSRRPAAKAGLIAARLFLCRPASVPRILRWRMHENIPTVPYQSPPGTLSRADCGFQKQHSCILVCQVTPRTT